MSIIGRPSKELKIVRKKDESTKSDKSIVSKTSVSKKTAAQSAGYELVSPGPNKKKTVGGTGTGYVLPSKKPIGAYELVGPAGGSGKKSSKTVQDTEEPSFWEGRQKSATKKKKGVDIVLIVGIAFLILFVLALVGGLGYIVYKYIINKPLPDLTNLCREAQENPVVDKKCYFHPKKYADSCTSTRCSTIGIKIVKKAQRLYNVKTVAASGITNIPNETPCGSYSWCYNGKCVTTNDVRIKEYEEKVKPREGGWRITCDKPECIIFVDNIGGTSKSAGPEFEEGLLHCMDLNNTICVHNTLGNLPYGVRLLSYAWRVCDNPLPLDSKREFCWYDQPNPLISIESCSLCPNSSNVMKSTAACDRNNGRRCDLLTRDDRTQIFGICFHGICVEIPEHEYEEKSALCPK